MAFIVVSNPTLGQPQPEVVNDDQQQQPATSNVRFAAPRREDGTLYSYELIIEGGKRRVYADTPTELCQVMIPGYPPSPTRSAPETTAPASATTGGSEETGNQTETEDEKLELEGERYFYRLRYAVGVQVQLQSFILSEVEEGDDVTDEEWAVLEAPRDVPPQIEVWECPVPLVLVESYYEPDGDLPRPKGLPRTPTPQETRTGNGATGSSDEGNDLDLADDSNLIWLNPLTELDLLESLHRCGYVTLAMANSSRPALPGS
jgi:hypothetical protein